MSFHRYYGNTNHFYPCNYRIISDKYLVSCDLMGTLKVWDLRSLLTMDIDHFPRQNSFSHLSALLVSADEFQIVVSDKVDVQKVEEGKSSCLFVKSFVGKMGEK